MIKLKELRKKLRLTQEQVAQALGLQKQTYQTYEWHTREADYKTLLKFADFFHVSLDELFGRENCDIINLNMLETEEQSIIKTIKQLNKINLAKVESYAFARLEEENSKK